MATSKKFSQLPAASSVGNGDLFAIAHEDAQAETGYVSQKLTAAQAGQKVNGDTEYPTGLPSFPTGSQNPFDALEKLNSDIDSLYPVVTETGAIANFTTSLALPLVELKAEIVAQQAGSGTPSPSNPRAISGFSSVDFTQQDSESTTVDSFTIQLGQTVYGGVLDVKNGKLTILTGFISDLSQLNWEYQSANDRFYSPDLNTIIKAPANNTRIADYILCSIYANGTSNQTASSGYDNIIAVSSSGNIHLKDTSLNGDVSALTSRLENQQFVYGLATPIEIDLTGDNFTTIAGEQNIFADCGDVTVGFKQGIQEYIDSKIAETQALIL